MAGRLSGQGKAEHALRVVQYASLEVDEQVARGSVVGPSFKKLDERAVQTDATGLRPVVLVDEGRISLVDHVCERVQSGRCDALEGGLMAGGSNS